MKNMTTQDFYNRNYISDNEADTLILMQEYARLKCKELLEIVAEKVKMKQIYNSPINGSTSSILLDIIGLENLTIITDKDSVLNAVDLDSFIS